VIEINDRVVREKVTLAKLENENSALQKQISMETDLEKIRLLAESKLNMQKPDKHQVVYIKVPKKDHALVAVSAQQSERGAASPIAYIAEQIELIRENLFLKK
ncbi:MAG: hypothetical protein LBU58_05900, partial [Clostridiales bacterium]|jgi:hypothetical protein|nr:hypothetical protein [Clostridiales bacterium]